MVDRIELASKYLGYSEKKNKEELQKLMRVDPTRTEWCATFITAIEKLSGEKGTENLTARSYLNYGVDTKKPTKGDIVVLWRGSRDSWQGHVGYLISQDTRTVTLLGGNQDKRVKVKVYPREKVLGYRIPPNKELL